MAEKVYAITIPVYATAYIKATSKKLAREAAHNLALSTCYLSHESEVEISEERFDSANLPDVSFSPVCTAAEKKVINRSEISLT